MRKVRFVIIAAVCSLIALCFIWAYSFELEHRANRLVRVCYEFSERGKPPSLEEIRNVFGSDLQQLGPCSVDQPIAASAAEPRQRGAPIKRRANSTVDG